jgi:hypothetical protein
MQTDDDDEMLLVIKVVATLPLPCGAVAVVSLPPSSRALCCSPRVLQSASAYAHPQPS